MLVNISQVATAALVLASSVSAAPRKRGPCKPQPPKPVACAARLDAAQNVSCIANVNGNDLEVKVLGNKAGPTILVVPSTFGHGYWYMQKGLESLFSKYNFIFYDARGSGPFSSKPADPL